MKNWRYWELRRHVFVWVVNLSGTPAGERLRWWVLWLHWVLFPLDTVRLRSKYLNYNFYTDTFTLYGREYGGEVFRAMKVLRPGEVFQLVSRDVNDRAMTLRKIPVKVMQ